MRWRGCRLGSSRRGTIWWWVERGWDLDGFDWWRIGWWVTTVGDDGPSMWFMLCDDCRSCVVAFPSLSFITFQLDVFAGVACLFAVFCSVRAVWAAV